MAAVTFDYPTCALRYPELATSVTSPLAGLYFAEATLYCDNTDCSVITDLNQRAMLLNMATAHIAALNSPLNGQASSPLVGRITNASEGSVSVQTQFDVPPGSAQWWAQTKYGAAFYAATAQFRVMQYFPGPEYIPDPYRPW